MEKNSSGDERTHLDDLHRSLSKWQRTFAALRMRVGVSGAYAIGVALLFLTAGFFVVKYYPFVQSLQGAFQEDRSAPPVEGAINVVVAKLARDTGASDSRALIIRSLRGLEGIGVAVRTREVIVTSDAAAERLQAEAQADVLVWGEVFRVGDQTEVELRMRVSESPQQLVRAYRPDARTFLLPRLFARDAVAVVGLTVFSRLHAARAADFEAGWLQTVSDNAASVERLLNAPASLLSALQRGQLELELGSSYVRIGEARGSASDIERGVVVIRRASDAFPKQQQPFLWATSQGRLAEGLRALANMRGSLETLVDSIGAHQAQLSVLAERGVPRQTSATHQNLCIGFLTYAAHYQGSREGKNALLLVARDHCSKALELAQSLGVDEFGASSAARRAFIASAQLNLGLVWLTEGEMERRAETIERAVALMTEALRGFDRELQPSQWANAKHNVGIALLSHGRLTANRKLVAKAIEELRDASVIRTEVANASTFAQTQDVLGSAYYILSILDRDLGSLEFAFSHYQASAKVRTAERWPLRSDDAKQKLEQVSTLRSRIRSGEPWPEIPRQ